MRRRRGQALVTGLLVALCLALAALVTAHLAHAVQERVRLQDTADAAAHSMATLEARTFNLYAYANRTQASHYVNAMLLQSLLSFLYFEEAFLTDAYGVMATLLPCGAEPAGAWSPVCAALEALPGVGAALRVLDGVARLVEVLVATFQAVLRASGVDERLGKEAIPSLLELNSALAHVSSALMQSTLEELASGARAVISANDPRVPRALAAGTEATLCLFDRAHVRAVNGSPLAPNLRPGEPLAPRVTHERDRRARAKRAMGQVANATRFGCDGSSPGCDPRFATARGLGALDQMPGAAALRALGTVEKHGQTRLLTHGMGRGDDAPDGGNLLREPADAPGAGLAMLAQGDVLGADDLYAIRLGPPTFLGAANPFSCGPTGDPRTCWGDPRHGQREDRPYRYMLETSIWAGGDADPVLAGGGLHWRVAQVHGPFVRGWVAPTAPGPRGAVGLNVFWQRAGGNLWVPVYVANVRPLHDGNHPWRGVAPFMHFEPGQFAEACALGAGSEASLDEAAARRAEFNQPSTWVVLELPAGAWTGAAGQPWPWRLAGIATSQGAVRLGSDADDPGAHGPHAFARAQVYYHRPGNWAEPPNFFNPFWRARLAPVWQGRDAFPPVRALVEALPPGLREQPQKVITH